MKRIGEEELRRILARNLPPEVKREEIIRLKQKMRLRADTMPQSILPESSFFHVLLRQIPYITTWVWGVQIGVVAFFALLLQGNLDSQQPVFLMSLSGPLLALLLVVDIARSFGCNMWEMEAACRHDLRKLTAMRMCIVGAADTAVLTAGCALWGKREGSIWEFALFAVLPFFLSSTVYLWELKIFSGKCGGYALAMTGMVLTLVCVPALRMIHAGMLAYYLDLAPVITACASILSGVIAVCAAVGLCGGLKSGKGETRRWSLE